MKFLKSLGLVLWFISGGVQAALLTINAPEISIVGDMFTIDIVLADTADLAGFEFDVNFDDTILEATSITSGDIFGLDTFELFNNIGGGIASFSETTFALDGVNITAPTVIATINFTADLAGFSSFMLSNVELLDSFADPISIDSISGAEITIKSATDGVDEPSILLLLTSLCVFMRRKYT